MTALVWTVALILVATLVSEDLTCIGVGLLIRQGELHPVVGVVGCLAGIFLGDAGLWLLGRLAGMGLVRWGLLHCFVSAQRIDELGAWFEQRGLWAVFAARFVPGTRLPLYLAAGVLGRQAGRFLLWTALAALLWTPLLVLGVALGGEAVVEPLTFLVGPGWLALLFACLGCFLLIRAGIMLSTATGRGRMIARVSRLWRWEFWPSWVFYLPLLPWLACLSLRYRSLLVWTAANPGIPHGGVVGESKAAILAQLPPDRVIPARLIPPGPIKERLEALTDSTFPLILKPDAGQRGAGVQKVNDRTEAEKYLLAQPLPVIAQDYHAGPLEVGVFYYRHPGEKKGHIFSITDKVFPVLVGNGRATVAELIWHHPRYRMQARVYLERNDGKRVLGAGERLTLTQTGNHSQGTLFRDGWDLWTPELEAAIDQISQQFTGFYIGRYDVRYTTEAEFKAGRDLAIVELNGATSESTNLYDPSWSLWRAYATLFRQWSLLYRIGAANRVAGHEPTSWRTLLGVLWHWHRARSASKESPFACSIQSGDKSPHCKK